MAPPRSRAASRSPLNPSFFIAIGVRPARCTRTPTPEPRHDALVPCPDPVSRPRALPDLALASGETICDELQDATPGLYGLCITYCEAQDCSEEDFDAMQAAQAEGLNLVSCNSTPRDGIPTLTASGPLCDSGSIGDFVGASDDLLIGSTGVNNTCFIRNIDELTCDFQLAVPAPDDIASEQASACYQLLHQYLQDLGLSCN